MGTLKWYKRDPRAALVGMMALTPVERGIYNTVLDLIYAHDGSLVDDEDAILPWMNCDPRTWRTVRARLLSLGKIFIHNGHIHNERATNEAAYSLNRIKVAREMAAKRWSDHRELKALVDAKAMTPTSTKILSYRPREK